MKTFYLRKRKCHTIAETVDGDETIITYKWHNKHKKHWVYEALPEWERDYILKLGEGV